MTTLPDKPSIASIEGSDGPPPPPPTADEVRRALNCLSGLRELWISQQLSERALNGPMCKLVAASDSHPPAV